MSNCVSNHNLSKVGKRLFTRLSAGYWGAADSFDSYASKAEAIYEVAVEVPPTRRTQCFVEKELLI